MLGFSDLEVRTYGILCLCGGLQILINQIEQPYARSLVVCDTPVNTTVGAEPSGSSMCGDRLHVIGEGAHLSGYGDSFENIGRFLITLFVSVFADSHGRKAAALVGWVLITASVLCFFLASFIRPWARVLFVTAQGLQGMSGIGLIADIVARDLASTCEGDPTALYGRRNFLGQMLGILFFGMVLVIQYSQITEFRPVWLSILLVSLAVLGAMVFRFPETQAMSDRKNGFEGKTTFGVVREEVRVYRNIMADNYFVRSSIRTDILRNLSGGFMIIFLPWMMAVFGYTQLDLMLMMAPCIIISVVSAPLIPALCARYGHRRVLNINFCLDFAIEWLGIPNLTRSIGFLPAPVLYAWIKTPMGGVTSVTEAVAARYIPSSIGAKVAAMNQLIGFLSGAVSSIMYTRVFDAEATTPVRRVAPMILASTLKTIGAVLYVRGHRRIVLEECDKLTEELAASKAAEGKAENAKKEN